MKTKIPDCRSQTVANHNQRKRLRILSFRAPAKKTSSLLTHLHLDRQIHVRAPNRLTGVVIVGLYPSCVAQHMPETPGCSKQGLEIQSFELGSEVNLPESRVVQYQQTAARSDIPKTQYRNIYHQVSYLYIKQMPSTGGLSSTRFVSQYAHARSSPTLAMQLSFVGLQTLKVPILD